MLEKYLDKSKKIKYFEKITSTNTVLKEMAANGEEENTILISDYQTKGRGRLGKTFFSPRGCGIYLSYLIKPEIAPKDAVFITVAAAVAMVRAIDNVFSVKTKIKWVNDIYYENKKLCGILTEGSIKDENTLSYAVLGLGINIKNPESGYPEDFAYKTTNLEEIAGDISDEKKWQLIGEFITTFDKVFSDKNKSYVKEYKEASCLTGCKIEILSGEHKGFAKALDIDDNARLVVEKDGKNFCIDSGDISICLV